jgi:hypothetical protein
LNTYLKNTLAKLATAMDGGNADFAGAKICQERYIFSRKDDEDRDAARGHFVATLPSWRTVLAKASLREVFI